MKRRKKEGDVSEREGELGAQEMVDFAGNRECVWVLWLPSQKSKQ